MTLDFRDGTPYSTRFGDVYYSSEDGATESAHVFLAGNDLPARWTDTDRFLIGETGFGTGLNFLVAWRAWRDTARPDARLHYLSLERYPLDPEILGRCHAAFPELELLSRELCSRLGQPSPGFHRLFLEQGRVVLTLCHGEALDMLRGMTAPMDAWFLDGFAPAKNPELWNEAVLREIARLSRPGTTFATFTSAGSVRRGLAAQGFAVQKTPGFGRKREMCRGVMEREPRYRPRAPWYALPPEAGGERSALVIGAGIAGAQAAWHLAYRGWSVKVLERHSAPAMEASGSPRAVFSPFLTARQSAEEQFSLQCFEYLLRQLDMLDPGREFHCRCGVLELSMNAERADRAARIAARGLPSTLVRAVNPEEASELAGIHVDQGGLFYPSAGWVNPGAWVKRLMAADGITLETGANVNDLEHADGIWRALDAPGDELGAAPVLVVASGRAMGWPVTRWIPFTPVAGQSSRLHAESMRHDLRCVIRHAGTVVPGDGGFHIVGSTFQRDEANGEANESADRENLETLRTHLPLLAEGAVASTAHSAVRMTSENRLPLVGALANPERLAAEYPHMHRRRYTRNEDDPAYPPGLFLSAAWGSRGMTNAALGGELLASLAGEEPPPLQAMLLHAVHPARSLVRRLQRG